MGHLVVSEFVAWTQSVVTIAAKARDQEFARVRREIWLAVAVRERVLDVDSALDVALKVIGVNAHDMPLPAAGALDGDEFYFFLAEHAGSPGHQERAEKGKAAHDQAANVSLEILLQDLIPATSSHFGSRHLASPRQVAGSVEPTTPDAGKYYTLPHRLTIAKCSHHH
jgi:hypothetical protein